MEVLQDDESLGDLGVQGVGSVEELEKLVVLHLEQHAGDLASKVGVLTRSDKLNELMYSDHDGLGTYGSICM